MIHTDSTGNTNIVNTIKSNTHDQSQNADAEESYTDLMNNMEYFSAFGFLLAVLSYELAHDKQMSD